MIPSIFTQGLSIPYYEIQQARTRTVWRVLAGIAAGLGCGILVGLFVRHFSHKWDCFRAPETAYKAGIISCAIFGLLIGFITGFVYGIGSILIPTIYDAGVQGVYKNSSFDNFAVCSQWPNSCGELDAFMIDGWFIDNPALVINVGNQQQKQEDATNPIKVILTNTNDKWNATFNYVQILQYYNTYFNEGVDPGSFLWAPTYYAPYRSPQIFEEYLDERGLDALLDPLTGTNMTTALLTGTTVENKAFAISAGQPVEILLLNVNANITTFVIGRQAIVDFTQPLANMTRNIAANQELVQRVRDFVGL